MKKIYIIMIFRKNILTVTVTFGRRLTTGAVRTQICAESWIVVFFNQAIS
jgi:hypothetical protein